MIIQNTNANQWAPPVRHVSDDAPTVVADTSTAATTSATNATAKVDPQQPSAQQLKSAVESLNQAMRKSTPNLEFSVDADTKKQIVKMVDTQTGTLIRQYPSEEVVAIARSIDQFLANQQVQHGLLLNQKA